MIEKVAELFRIARKEGALRKYADGKSDAEEAISLLKEEIEKSLLTDEEIWRVYGVDYTDGDIRAIAEAQLDKVLKRLIGR